MVHPRLCFCVSFQVTGTEFTDKQQTKAIVERLASSLKREVNPDMAASIEGRLGELQEKWRSLEEKLSERKTGKWIFFFSRREPYTILKKMSSSTHILA